MQGDLLTFAFETQLKLNCYRSRHTYEATKNKCIPEQLFFVLLNG